MALPFMPNNPEDGLLNLAAQLYGNVINAITGLDLKAQGIAQNLDESLAGTVMQAFNQFLWMIAMLLMMVSIIQTLGKNAATGEGFKQFASSKNSMIRLSLGTILLMPTTWGYNVLTVIIFTLSSWGIMGANYIAEAGIKWMFKQTMQSTAHQYLLNNIDISEQAKNIYQMAYCRKNMQESYQPLSQTSENNAQTPENTTNKSLNALKYDTKTGLDIENLSEQSSTPHYAHSRPQTIAETNLGKQGKLITYQSMVADSGQSALATDCGTLSLQVYQENEENQAQTNESNPTKTNANTQTDLIMGYEVEQLVHESLYPIISTAWVSMYRHLTEEADKLVAQIPVNENDAAYQDWNATKQAELETQYKTFQEQALTQFKAQLTHYLNDEQGGSGVLDQFTKAYMEIIKKRGVLELIGLDGHLAKIKALAGGILSKNYLQVQATPVENYNNAFSHINSLTQTRQARGDIAVKQTICSLDAQSQNPDQLEKQLFEMILSAIQLGNSPCFSATNTANQSFLSKVASLSAVLEAQYTNIDKLALNIQKNSGKDAKANPESQQKLQSIKEQLKLTSERFSRLPMFLDAYLALIFIVFFIKTTVLILTGSMWATSLFGFAGSISNGSFAKELAIYVMLLPMSIATYFLSLQLVNVLLPFILKISVKSLSMYQHTESLSLSTLNDGLMLFGVLSGITLFFIGYMQVLVPNTIAKFMGTSGDDAMNQANSKMDMGINARNQPSGQKAGGTGSGGDTKQIGTEIKNPLETLPNNTPMNTGGTPSTDTGNLNNSINLEQAAKNMQSKTDSTL